MQYINRTFSLAAPNVAINGLPVEISSFLPTVQGADASTTTTAAEQAYEPFDTRKRQRVEDLTREEEDLLREIAALKRSVPGAAAQRLADASRSGIKADEEALAAMRGAAAALGPEILSAEGGAGVAAPALERQADVERAFREAVEGLGRLKKEMPATVARMERARVAGEYVLTQR